MLNWIFLALIVAATLTGALTGTMSAVSDASINYAKIAVNLAIGLIGQMALWLGVMQVLQEAGMMRSIARFMRPIMSRLFPDIPPEHPAMSAMIMNIVANMIGLANAATPFGLKAMVELNKLNKQKGVATDAMVLFLAINTSGVAVMPLGVVAVRASMGASNVTGIFVPSMLATACSTIVAIILAKSLQRLGIFSVARAKEDEGAAKEALLDIKGLDHAEEIAAIDRPVDRPRAAMAVGVMLVLCYGLYVTLNAQADKDGFALLKDVLSYWILPVIMMGILLIGFVKRVAVYEAVIKGAKEGFNICVLIIPFLVAILVAIGMFRASGAMDYLVSAIQPITGLVGLPAEALPMALIRPLSGSGALAVMTEAMKAHGPDSFVGFLVSVMNGSTETTFYVVAVYFGSVGVRAARHTILACLAADITGVFAALFFSRLFFS